MRAWHETLLPDHELSESFDDAMSESGLNPNSFEDSKAFADRANREALDGGTGDQSVVQVRDPETGQIYPPSGGVSGWFEESWLGRTLNKG